MFGSSALDVTIGLLFIFAVFSLLTSGIQEGIAAVLARRSRNLWDSLDELFGSAAVSDGATEHKLIDVFYESPFVTHLVTPKRRKKMAAPLSGTAKKVRGANVSVNRSIVDENDAEDGAKAQKRRAARIYGPTSIAPASFSRALLDVIKPSGDFDRATHDLKTAIGNMAGDPDDGFKRTLRRLVDEAAGDVDKFRTSLEQWFENQMNHVTEWYRRNTRVWLFLIGLAVAAAFNVDTIDAGVELWHDDELRAALVAEASTTDEFSQCQAIEDAGTRTSCVEDVIGSIDDLPIGYGDGWDAGFGSTLLRFVGWVITAAAMMAGAAFWFDLLRRAISLKGRINSATSPTS